MHRAVSVRLFSWLLGLAFVSSVLFTAAGCGEDMSQNKTITPEALPKDKAKDSMEFYTKQMQKGAAKKK
jgi:hypothetical protein